MSEGDRTLLFIYCVPEILPHLSAFVSSKREPPPLQETPITPLPSLYPYTGKPGAPPRGAHGLESIFGFPLNYKQHKLPNSCVINNGESGKGQHWELLGRHRMAYPGTCCPLQPGHPHRWHLAQKLKINSKKCLGKGSDSGRISTSLHNCTCLCWVENTHCQVMKWGLGGSIIHYHISAWVVSKPQLFPRVWNIILFIY